MHEENIYISDKSFKEELTRIVVQARLLFMGQRPFIEKLDIPSGPGRLIDIGAGPGVYLESLRGYFPGYEILGVDISPRMLAYLKFCYPGIRTIEGSVYSMPFGDDYADIIHASSLFIHLPDHEAAIREIQRVLKPGGLLIVTDVDDSTFSGPESFLELINRYNDIYEGDRKIMSKLDSISAPYDFKLIKSFVVELDNTGSDVCPSEGCPGIHIGKMTMWGFLSFLGQRHEVRKYFEAAKNYYLNHNLKISVSIKTHVYQLEG